MSNMLSPDTMDPDADLALYAVAHPQAMQTLCELRATLEEEASCPVPVVSVADIVAFERFFGVSLPYEYQMFLRVVGNGIHETYFHVNGIPLSGEIDTPKLQAAVEQIRTPFALEADIGFSDDYDDLEVTEEDREACRGQTDQNIRLDKFDRLRDDMAAKIWHWSHCGTWELQDNAFLVLNGKRVGTVWTETEEWFPDGSGEHTLNEEGSFLDWVTSDERKW